MRFSQLNLMRFGHFSALRLSFAGDAPGLHLIYGANEAGKSTALRAIGGLLYGIPDRSADTHTHGGDLRVAATLREGQAEQTFVRRKGRKKTLLDVDGQALPEAALAPFLHGIPETTFHSLYGLDHESLRRGAESLLLEGGQLGGSLFDAGVGGRSVQALLERLRSDARELFMARGQRPKLNAALEEYKQARRRIAEQALRVDVYREQEQAIEQVREQENRLRGQRRERAQERARLQRAVQLLPLLGRRAALLERLDALGDGPRLPEDASARREKAQLELARSEPELAQRREELVRLQDALAKISVPQELLAVDAEVIEDIRDRLGSQRKARKELPACQSRLRSLNAERQGVQRRLKLSQKLEDAEQLRAALGTAERAQIRGLLRDHSGLSHTLRQSAERRELQQRYLQDWAQELAEHAGGVEGEGLQQAVMRARQTLERTTERAGSEVELAAAQRQWQQAQRALRPYLVETSPWLSEPLVEGGVLPVVETAQAHAREAERNAQLTVEQDRQRQRIQEKHDALAVELDTLWRQGDIPTEDELRRVRAQRDALLEQTGEVQWAERLPSLLTWVRRSDDVADRLRRESERTARLARLLAEQQDTKTQLERSAAAATTLAERVAAQEAAFLRFLQEFGLRTTLAPGEGEAVAELLHAAAARLAEVQRVGDRLQGWRRAQHEVRDVLWAQLGQPGPVGERELPEVLALGEELLAVQEQNRTERVVLERQLREGRAEMVRLEAAYRGHHVAFQKWQAQWKQAMNLLRLAEDTSVDQAQATMDDLSELFSKMEDGDRLRERIAQLEQEQEAFGKDVFRLRDRYVFQLAGDVDVDEVAQELIHGYEQARRDAAERGRLQQAQADQAQAIAELELRCRQAHNVLERLCSQAGVTTAAELQAVEGRGAEASRLERDLEGAQADIIRVAAGATLAEVLEDVSGIRIEVATARIEELDQALEALEHELDQVTREVVAKEKALEQVRAREGAAGAATELAEAAEACRQHARGYIRLRLAEALLEREIRAYRELHQGPLLTRASELFGQLTCGRFVGLSADFDARDEPVLRCQRIDGASVGVEGLSDGSRDPLYLALRLATLERYGADRLPLCLDDILIHADDERATAALRVLGDFAAHTQVLFFTHHDHLRQLARTTLDDRLHEHVLPAPVAANGAQSNVQADAQSQSQGLPGGVP